MIAIMTCLSCPSHSQQLLVRQVQLQELSVSSLRNLCQAPNGTEIRRFFQYQATHGLMQAMQFNNHSGMVNIAPIKNADDIGVVYGIESDRCLGMNSEPVEFRLKIPRSSVLSCPVGSCSFRNFR